AASSAGGYNTIQEEGSALTQRTTLNFAGNLLTGSDSGGITVVQAGKNAAGTDLFGFGNTAPHLTLGRIGHTVELQETVNVSGVLSVSGILNTSGYIAFTQTLATGGNSLLGIVPERMGNEGRDTNSNQLSFWTEGTKRVSIGLDYQNKGDSSVDVRTGGLSVSGHLSTSGYLAFTQGTGTNYISTVGGLGADNNAIGLIASNAIGTILNGTEKARFDNDGLRIINGGVTLSGTHTILAGSYGIGRSATNRISIITNGSEEVYLSTDAIMRFEKSYKITANASSFTMVVGAGIDWGGGDDCYTQYYAGAHATVPSVMALVCANRNANARIRFYFGSQTDANEALAIDKQQNLYLRHGHISTSGHISASGYLTFSAAAPIGVETVGLGRSTTDGVAIFSSGVEAARFDQATSAGETRFMIYDVDNATLERVTVGAPDSGGTGKKLLCINN
ncbi:hypothetical protein HY496_02495, partial [Candidatus Woesearchaeota archaeon]|nr:hypothetical protein [Candidatus Woesearchaeota archaeon]